MKKFLIGAGVIALVGGFIVGSKFMAKADQAKQLQAKLLEVCALDKECLAAVEKHFQGCFDSNYDFGGRRRAGSVKPQEFTSCINSKAGKEFFAYEK